VKIIRWGAVLGAVAALALATPAAAHHNEAQATITFDGCALSGASEWEIDDHQVGNTVLVVRVDGQVWSAPVGELLEITLEPGTQSVDWRVWGGGERDYDSPPLSDLDALVEYLNGGGGELDADAPGVDWHTLAVPDCPAPDPTTEPTVEPTAGPTATPATTPAGGESPAPGAGAELPTTGVPTWGLAAAGGVLLLAGTGAVLVGRRRRLSLD